MVPNRQRVVYEVHPEVCFRALNNGVPIPLSKKSREGEDHRKAVLIRSGFPRPFIEEMAVKFRVGRDDFLDACAALWTARRIQAGQAQRLPAVIDLDRRGLDQAIWY